MKSFSALEPAIDPNNRITFLLDWELTMKCNLDCSYCSTGINGGHDNSQPHPPLDQCLRTVDFMFAYVDKYMQRRRRSLRHVVLNIYGGESLHHPNIVEILKQVRATYQAYQDRWALKITCTTNAIISRKKLQAVLGLIDEFTVSYHAENSAKYKALFKNNLLEIQAAGKDLKCVVLVHSDPELFADSLVMTEWLKSHTIKHLPRQLDHPARQTQFNYDQKQVVWFKNLYEDKAYKSQNNEIVPMQDDTGLHDLTQTGRACCGGRQVCVDQSYKNREYFVLNSFRGWFCSVNEFFLYIKQVNGHVYVNKDCKMNFDGTVGPIGNLSDPQAILDKLQHDLDNGMPVIQCNKFRCLCGLCAPKAQNRETYDKIMRNYKL